MNGVWLAVGEDGVALLDYTTMHPTSRFPYDNIVTFGGCQVNQLMSKISRTVNVFKLFPFSSNVQ